jgi:uncharacterized protein
MNWAVVSGGRNDVPIDEGKRRIFGPRPEEERGRSFSLR